MKEQKKGKSGKDEEKKKVEKKEEEKEETEKKRRRSRKEKRRRRGRGRRGGEGRGAGEEEEEENALCANHTHRPFTFPSHPLFARREAKNQLKRGTKGATAANLHDCLEVQQTTHAHSLHFIRHKAILQIFTLRESNGESEKGRCRLLKHSWH